MLSPSLASLGAQQSSECQGDDRGKTTRLTLQLLAMQQAMWSELCKDPKFRADYTQMPMSQAKKSQGLKRSPEEEATLEKFNTFASKMGVTPEKIMEDMASNITPTEDPFPVSSVDRNMKKVQTALKKGERAPIKPLFFLAHACSAEPWMKPAIEAKIIPLLKRVADSERKRRLKLKKSEASSRLFWSVFAQAEVYMHPDTLDLVDLQYFFDLLNDKNATLLEKSVCGKALADHLGAAHQLSYAREVAELMRVVKNAPVMEQLTQLIESNDTAIWHVPVRLDIEFLLF